MALQSRYGERTSAACFGTLTRRRSALVAVSPCPGRISPSITSSPIQRAAPQPSRTRSWCVWTARGEKARG